MRIVVRPKGSNILKVMEFATQEEAEAAMIRYIEEGTAGDTVPAFFRVIPGATSGDDIVLRKIRLRPGSEVTTTKLVGGTFEDDV